jgi:hypothetical protein
VAADSKLWNEPTQFAQPLALLKTGLELDVLRYSSDRGWMKVRTPGGREGWIEVRFTTQAGRRTFPLNAQFASQRASRRSPASVDLQAPSAEDFDSSKSWEGLLGMEYMNQVTREKASGFGFDLSALHRLSNNWSMGAAFTWNRFSKSESLDGFSTSRSSHRLFPHLLTRYRFGDFRMDMGLGYAMDRTSIDTRDSSGDLIEENEDGDLVSGSGTESSLGLRLTPRYILPVSRLVKVGFYLTYSMDVALSSGEGDFTSEDAVSSPYSYLGGGVSVAIDF